MSLISPNFAVKSIIFSQLWPEAFSQKYLVKAPEGRFSLKRVNLALTSELNENGISHLAYCSALDKLLGQLGIYATWLSSIGYLQKQLRIFIFFYATFFFL